MSETTNLKLFKHDNPSTNQNQFDVDKAINQNWDKVDDFATKTDKNVVNLEEKCKELNEENQRLREDINSLPSGQATGENITINDSAEARFKKFIVNGNTIETRNCGDNINLLSPNWANDILERLELTSHLADYITEIDGHRYFKYYASLGYQSGLNYFAKDCFKENTQYTMKCVLMRSKDNLTSTNIQVEYTDGTALYVTLPEPVKSMTRIECKFTTLAEKTVKEIRIGYQSETTYIDLNKCTIYEGIEDLSYTSYKCGSINFKATNSNLLKIEDNETVIAGRRYKLDEQKRLCINDEGQVSAVSIRLSDMFYTSNIIVSYDNKLILKTNCTLYFIINKYSGEETLGSFYIQTFIKNFNTGETRNTQISYTLTGKLKIDLADGEYITDIWMWNGTANTFKNVVIELSITEEENSNYIPYEEQRISFPLKEGQVLHKGDYLADDEVHHKKKTIELNGTEAITLDSYSVDNENTLHFNTPIYSDMKLAENIVTKPNYMSNLFKTPTLVWSADEEQIAQMNNKSFNISINRDKLETEDVNGFKKWLTEQKNKGNPLKIEYELANEVVEPYSPEQQEVYKQLQNLKSYKGTTHIISTDEVSPIFEVEYIKDLETILTKG